MRRALGSCSSLSSSCRFGNRLPVKVSAEVVVEEEFAAAAAAEDEVEDTAAAAGVPEIEAIIR
jgi:hypothetical protein